MDKVNGIKALKKERQSNFELLRIVAMVMIIIYHIELHAILPQLTDESLYSRSWMGFNQLFFYYRLLISQTFFTFGKTGNGIFILITGYFLVDRAVDIYKPIKKLLSQTLFASALIVITSYLYYLLFWSDFNGMQSIYIFNSDWWFIGYYISVTISASLFLNKFLARLSKRQYETLLFAVFSFISIAWLSGILSGLSHNLHAFVTGIFLYSFGGYIRKYEPFKNVRSSSLYIALASLIGLICLSYYNITMSEVNNCILSGKKYYRHTLYDYGNFNLIIIAMAVVIFEIFRRINIKNSKIINTIASATFMIYLIHENKFLQNIYNKIDWIRLYYDDLPQFLLLFFAWVLLLFALGLVGYYLYILFVKLTKTKFLHKIIFKT